MRSCKRSARVNVIWAASVDVQQSEMILARSCEARPGVLFTLSNAVLTAPFEIVEALYLYPLFYPLVKIFRRYVRAREMMRFSRLPSVEQSRAHEKK